MEFIFIAALVALLIFWFFLRKRDGSGRTKQQGATARPERRASQASGEYHAVTIRLGRQTCSAVRELSGERFLAADAPRLPLPECDVAAHCECSFVHHKDRRSGQDRRSPFGSRGISMATGEYEKERRAGGERRRDEDDYF